MRRHGGLWCGSGASVAGPGISYGKGSESSSPPPGHRKISRKDATKHGRRRKRETVRLGTYTEKSRHCARVGFSACSALDCTFAKKLKPDHPILAHATVWHMHFFNPVITSYNTANSMKRLLNAFVPTREKQT